MNRRHRQDLEIQSSLIAFLNPDLCRPASDLIEVGGIKPFALIDVVDSHDKICSNVIVPPSCTPGSGVSATETSSPATTSDLLDATG